MKKSIIYGMFSVLIIVLVSIFAMHQVNSKPSSLLLSNVEALTADEEEGFQYVNGGYKQEYDPNTNTKIQVAYLICTGEGSSECKFSD